MIRLCLKHFTPSATLSWFFVAVVFLIPNSLRALEVNFQLGGAVSKSQSKHYQPSSSEFIWGHFLIGPSSWQTRFVNASAGLRLGFTRSSANRPLTAENRHTTLATSVQSSSRLAGLVLFLESMNILNDLRLYVRPSVSHQRASVSFASKVKSSAGYVSAIRRVNAEYGGSSFQVGTGVAHQFLPDVKLLFGASYSRNVLKLRSDPQRLTTQTKTSLRAPKISLIEANNGTIDVPKRWQHDSFGFELGLAVQL